MENDNILEVKKLSVSFFYNKKEGKAVEDVNFSVKRGEVLGIVGESGSGKSVTAMAVMQLLRNTTGQVKSGEILFNGEDLLKKDRRQMRKIRGKKIGMVFQEPMTSLNPALTIGDQITETILQHENVSKKEAYNRAKELLEVVQIPLAEARLKEYPHQLSGGMRQRVMIAMALSCNPDLIIADEPTTALDVTIQSQILELFKDLRRRFNMTVILITHDMGVVADLADKTLVMYAGHVVEYGNTLSILKEPKHPYTQALIRAIPKLDTYQEYLEAIPGSIPSIYAMPSGCNFHPRCKKASAVCAEKRPELKYAGDRLVSCWNISEENGDGV